MEEKSIVVRGHAVQQPQRREPAMEHNSIRNRPVRHDRVQRHEHGRRATATNMTRKVQRWSPPKKTTTGGGVASRTTHRREGLEPDVCAAYICGLLYCSLGSSNYYLIQTVNDCT